MSSALLIAAVLLAVVVVARRFAPTVASVLDIVVVIGIGVWGAFAYFRGGGVNLLGGRIPPVVFFVFLALLVVFEALNLYSSLKRRRDSTERTQP